MKKKIIALTMLLMSVCIAGGCGKKEEITAEGLINQSSTTEESVQCDLDVAVSVETEIGDIFSDTEEPSVEEPSVDEPTEDKELIFETEVEDIQASEDSDSSSSKSTMQMDMKYKGTIKVGDNGNGELDGTLDMTLFGFNQSTPFKGYLEKNEKGYTSYITSDDEKYEKKDIENSDLGINNLDSSMIDNLTLDDSEKDIYKVSGSVSIKNIFGKFKENPLFKDSFTDKDSKSLDEIEDFNININWAFDKDSKKLKTLDLAIDEGANLGVVTIKSLVIKMSMSDYSGNIDIPQDVKDNATSSDIGSSEYPVNEIDSDSEDIFSIDADESLSYEEMDSAIADEINNSLQSDIIE